MDYVTLISTVGFPIVAYMMMWHFMTKTMKDNTKAIEELIIAVNLFSKLK